MDPFGWIGTISGRDLTPYEVLGLEPFESDPAKIADALAQARRRLGPLRESLHAERCQKLLELVAKAEAILRDPKHKRACDDQLRKRLATASPSLAGAIDSASRARPDRRERRAIRRWSVSRARQWIKLLVALLLLAATVFLFRDWIWSTPRFPKHRSPTPKGEARQPFMTQESVLA